jgi:hypothetical protein
MKARENQMARSRWISVVSILIFMFGTSTLGQAGLFSSDDELTEYQGADAGVLALSLGAYKGADYSIYRLFFRTRNGKKSGDLTYNRFSRPDYSDAYISGAIRTYSLEPGDYQIYDFELFFSNGFVEQRFSAKEPFSIPFTIKPKQTVYLGEFRAMAIEGQNLFGLPAHAGAKFLLSDQSARDIPIARAQDTRVANPEIRIPDPAAIGSPIFERLPGAGR